MTETFFSASYSPPVTRYIDVRVPDTWTEVDLTCPMCGEDTILLRSKDVIFHIYGDGDVCPRPDPRGGGELVIWTDSMLRDRHENLPDLRGYDPRERRNAR